MHVYIYICICICMYVYIYIYVIIYMHKYTIYTMPPFKGVGRVKLNYFILEGCPPPHT